MVSSSGKEKTPEERQAELELEKLIDRTAHPKGLGQGLTSGVGNILGGAVGAVGIAVMAPTLGLAVGAKNAGVLGGLVGLAGGALIGLVGGAAVLVGAAVSGATQVVRGVLAAPEAAMAPRQGKWWNENEGRWVLTKMTDETHILDNVPSDDSDLLGDIQAELDDRASKRDLLTTVTVKETFYYDTLEVPADADDGTIRRRYYLMAKKYHPDRQPSGDQEAAEKFKEIAEAYQVLSDPELRKRYDRDGRDGLSADKTSTADGMAKVDPAVLYAFLFGSDQFNDYVGRLATATSASVGDSPKVSAKTAKLLQKRRLVRLAVSLLKKIEPHVIAQEHGEEPMEVEDSWTAEALELSKASYGYEMLQCIGQSYNLMGAMYQGSINSGQGLPSVSAWAARQRAILDKKKSQNKNTMGGVRAGVDMLKMQQELMIKMQQAKAVDEREALEKEMNDAAVGIMLRVLWTTTVVDVTSTLYEMTHMIFFDQDVPKDVRWRRSEAVKALGSIFMSVPEPEDSQDQDLKQMYEDAAFAAMLETVKRRDAATK